MKRLLMAALALPFAVHAGDPFLIFGADAAYTDPAIAPLIQKYLTSQDYLGFRALTRRPELAGVVAPNHSVEVSGSLAGLTDRLATGCGIKTPGVLYYAWGDASMNPAIELKDPVDSITRAAAMVKASGCHQMGLIPEALFFGSSGCGVDLSNGLYQEVDWSRIAFLDITGNWMLSDACAGKATVQDYVAFVRTVAGFVRGKNPSLVITAHLSFGSAKPAALIAAARELGNLVDGIQLAYPLSSAHEHVYSTAGNLEAVLSALRPR